jgi:hypothetical protein
MALERQPRSAPPPQRRRIGPVGWVTLGINLIWGSVVVVANLEGLLAFLERLGITALTWPMA